MQKLKENLNQSQIAVKGSDTAEPTAVGNTVEQKVVILSCVKRFIEIAFV